MTTGTVTMPTGRFETARGYIQADGAGILIHLVPRSPALSLGQTVRIKGRVHHYHGEVELAALSGGVEAMDEGAEPAPAVETPAGIGAETEALLVQLSGAVIARTTGYVSLGDQGQSVQVYFYPRLGLQSSQFTVGQSVVIVGVVNGSAGSRGYRLLPRGANDISGTVLPDGTPLSEAETGSEAGLASAAERPSPGERAATETAFATPVIRSREPADLSLHQLVEAPSEPAGAALAGRKLTAEPARRSWHDPPARAWLWTGLAVVIASALGGAAFYLRRR